MEKQKLTFQEIVNKLVFTRSKYDVHVLLKKEFKKDTKSLNAFLWDLEGLLYRIDIDYFILMYKYLYGIDYDARKKKRTTLEEYYLHGKDFFIKKSHIIIRRVKDTQKEEIQKEEFDELDKKAFQEMNNGVIKLRHRYDFCELMEKCEELKKQITNPHPLHNFTEQTSPAVPETENIKPLQWNGTPTQLTELVQALIECKLLPPELTQREIYSRFKVFFNMDFDHENIKKKIRQRTKDLTPLLEKLMISMEQYVRKDD